VLGIAGCSGSGKTTLACELARALNGIHFHLDSYYRDLSHMPLAERATENFDDLPSLKPSAGRAHCSPGQGRSHRAAALRLRHILPHSRPN